MRFSSDCARVTPLCFRRMVGCGVPLRFPPCPLPFLSESADGPGTPTHLGLTWHPCDARSKCPDRCVLPLLQFGDVLTVENGRLLGPNDCLHVKNHASVPV